MRLVRLRRSWVCGRARSDLSAPEAGVRIARDLVEQRADPRLRADERISVELEVAAHPVDGPRPPARAVAESRDAHARPLRALLGSPGRTTLPDRDRVPHRLDFEPDRILHPWRNFGSGVPLDQLGSEFDLRSWHGRRAYLLAFRGAQTRHRQPARTHRTSAYNGAIATAARQTESEVERRGVAAARLQALLGRDPSRSFTDELIAERRAPASRYGRKATTDAADWPNAPPASDRASRVRRGHKRTP